MKNRTSWRDLALFGKIVSTALLFGGYILMGLFIGRNLASKGYPQWTIPAGAICGTLIGAIHGAMAIKDIINRRKSN